MKIYFAPMEGITGYVYRNIYEECYGGADKYFAPFIATKSEQKITWKDLKDILPEKNGKVPLIPQILSNKAEDFLIMLEVIKELGYKEVNINLGCPSRTVVTKKKGSGLLAYPDELNRFLEEVFAKADIAISVKTRTGMSSHHEMHRLMEIYNQYPLKELIVHPRVQADYYKNKPDWEIFRYIRSVSTNPVCYNGDIFTAEDYRLFTDEFPDVNCVMLGRGLLMNPGLLAEIEGNKPYDAAQLKAFHERIYEEYKSVLYGDRAVLFKMKELWAYMMQNIPGDDAHKVLKKIRKAEKTEKYDEIINNFLKKF